MGRERRHLKRRRRSHPSQLLITASPEDCRTRAVSMALDDRLCTVRVLLLACKKQMSGKLFLSATTSSNDGISTACRQIRIFFADAAVPRTRDICECLACLHPLGNVSSGAQPCHISADQPLRQHSERRTLSVQSLVRKPAERSLNAADNYRLPYKASFRRTYNIVARSTFGHAHCRIVNNVQPELCARCICATIESSHRQRREKSRARPSAMKHLGLPSAVQ
jgi:hypothetical protein